MLRKKNRFVDDRLIRTKFDDEGMISRQVTILTEHREQFNFYLVSRSMNAT